MSFFPSQLNSINKKVERLWVPVLVVGVLIFLGIQPHNKAPEAGFSYLAGTEGAEIRTGMRVAFYNQSKDLDGDRLSCHWDFGDGVTSTEEAPSHVFQNPRDFAVTLLVRDSEGAESLATEIVKVQPAGPIASFEANPLNPITNSPVIFLDRSSHPAGNRIVKSTWIFDMASKEATVSRSGSGFQEQHVYSRSGTYTVMLTVEDDQGLQASSVRNIVVGDVTLILNKLEDTIGQLKKSIDNLGLKVQELNISFTGLKEDVKRVFGDIRYWIPLIVAFIGLAVAFWSLWKSRRRKPS